MFFTLFSQPLLNLLFFFVWLVPTHDVGIAIILLTATINTFLYPLRRAARRSQETMKRLQPKLAQIKSRFPKDREKELQASLALYREERVNPFVLMAGNLVLLAVQIPILFALFRLFSHDITPALLAGLYSFVPPTTEFTRTLVGIVDLTKPNVALALIAGITQFFQVRLSARNMATPQTGTAAGAPLEFGALLQKQMQYVFPLLTIVIAWRLPAAMALYWCTFTFLSVGEELWRLRRERFSSIPASPPSAGPSAS